MLPKQVDQWFEDIIQADDPVRYRRVADRSTIAFQNLLEAIQRQSIGVFCDLEIGQQQNTGDALAQRMHRTGRGLDRRFAGVVLEDRLLLPVLEGSRLGRHAVQLFFDFGEEGRRGPDLLILAQRQIDAHARQPVGEAVV